MMAKISTKSQFEAKLLCPAKSGRDTPWAFVVLPASVSAKLPRRGRTSIEGTINGYGFHATLEPDGQLSHWLPINKALLEAAGVNIGDTTMFEIMSVDQEPEPEIPSDLQEALLASPQAKAVWDETTTIARVDWIHWITSAKQTKTRTQRIISACDMLASGKRRVCCFDPSGHYNNAFCAPKVAD